MLRPVSIAQIFLFNFWLDKQVGKKFCIRLSARRYNLWETWIVSKNYFSSITEYVVLKWSVYLGYIFPDIQNNFIFPIPPPPQNNVGLCFYLIQRTSEKTYWHYHFYKILKEIVTMLEGCRLIFIGMLELAYNSHIINKYCPQSNNLVTFKQGV